jgi:WD40 repeat protein
MKNQKIMNYLFYEGVFMKNCIILSIFIFLFISCGNKGDEKSENKTSRKSVKIKKEILLKIPKTIFKDDINRFQIPPYKVIYFLKNFVDPYTYYFFEFNPATFLTRFLYTNKNEKFIIEKLYFKKERVFALVKEGDKYSIIEIKIDGSKKYKKLGNIKCKIGIIQKNTYLSPDAKYYFCYKKITKDNDYYDTEWTENYLGIDLHILKTGKKILSYKNKNMIPEFNFKVKWEKEKFYFQLKDSYDYVYNKGPAPPDYALKGVWEVNIKNKKVKRFRGKNISISMNKSKMETTDGTWRMEFSKLNFYERKYRNSLKIPVAKNGLSNPTFFGWIPYKITKKEKNLIWRPVRIPKFIDISLGEDEKTKLRKMMKTPHEATGYAISRDGKSMITSGDKEPVSWKKIKGKWKSIKHLGDQNAINVDFSNDGKWYLVQEKTNSFVLWDAKLGKKLERIGQYLGIFTKNSKYLLSTQKLSNNKDGSELNVHNISSDVDLLHTTKICNPDVIALTSKNFIGVGCSFDKVEFYQLIEKKSGNGKIILKPVGKIKFKNPGQILSMDFSKDGKVIAIAMDKRVELREVSSGKLLASLKGHHSLISSVIWVKNKLITASYDGNVVLWNNKGKILNFFEKIDGVTFKLTQIKGEKVAGLVKNLGSLVYWDLKTGKKVDSLVISTYPE